MIGIFYERDVNHMSKIKAFLKKKDIVFTLRRYGIDALGAMAQGLFCTLLVGTILNTIGQQFGIGFLNQVIVTIGTGVLSLVCYSEAWLSVAVGASMIFDGVSDIWIVWIMAATKRGASKMTEVIETESTEIIEAE